MGSYFPEGPIPQSSGIAGLAEQRVLAGCRRTTNRCSLRIHIVLVSIERQKEQQQPRGSQRPPPQNNVAL